MTDKKVARNWKFICDLEEIKEIGESKILRLDMKKNTVHCYIYKYKKSKELNPGGRDYSVRPLGDNNYMFTLIKKGS